jgi:hypothetical protein
MVEEFNREHFDVSHGLEVGNTDVMPSCYVQKDTVYEKQEGFDV